MAELHPKAFKRPFIAFVLLAFVIIPMLLAGILYTYRPTRALTNGPRLMFGRSASLLRPAVSVTSMEETPMIIPPNYLGYRPTVSLSNAMVAYRSREGFAAGIRPTAAMWFGVVCPLYPEEADAYEAQLRAAAKEAKVEVPTWVKQRPLYSLDCSRDYPEGFDFTLMAALPLYHVQQFRVDVWSGQETPVRNIRQMTNMSIVDYTRKAVDEEASSQKQDDEVRMDTSSSTPVMVVGTEEVGGSSNPKRHKEGAVEGPALLEQVPSIRNRKHEEGVTAPALGYIAPPATIIPSSSNVLDMGSSSHTSGGYTAATSITNTETIKTCDKVTDECVQAAMFTYTNSYKLIYPQTNVGVGTSVGTDGTVRRGAYPSYTGGRLVVQQPGTSGLWQVSITSDLGKSIAEIDILLVAEPAVGTRSNVFRGLLGLVFFAAFILLFVTVKLVGLHMRSRDTTRIFAVIDPHHDEIIQEGWDDCRKLAQYIAFKVGETRVRWSAAASSSSSRRRRGGRHTPNQTDALTSASANNSDGEASNNNSTTALTPTAALAAKAKASQAAATAAVAAGTNPNAGYPSSSEEEGDVCRICRCGEPQSDLIAPCACSGTSRYIHRSCLEQWRSMTANPEHRRICAECKTEYNVELRVERHTCAQRTMKGFLPFIKLAFVVSSFVVFGYVIKAVALIVTRDPNIDWRINFYHVFIGSLALCSTMIVFSNGLFFVIDYPKTLYQRLPALLLLGVGGPILLGYMSQLWGAVLFETVVTPEISFGSGVFTFIAFVNNILIKLTETLAPHDDEPPTRSRSPLSADLAALEEASALTGTAAGEDGSAAAQSADENAAAVDGSAPTAVSSGAAVVEVPPTTTPSYGGTAESDANNSAATAAGLLSSASDSSIAIVAGEGSGRSRRAAANDDEAADNHAEAVEMELTPSSPTTSVSASTTAVLVPHDDATAVSVANVNATMDLGMAEEGVGVSSANTNTPAAVSDADFA